jgi:hypothetical protein
LLQLLGTASVVPGLLILFILLMVALRSSEISVYTTATRRIIPKDDILHTHSRENLKSYMALTGWAL